jgi:hypothetical protein
MSKQKSVSSDNAGKARVRFLSLKEQLRRRELRIKNGEQIVPGVFRFHSERIPEKKEE